VFGHTCTPLGASVAHALRLYKHQAHRRMEWVTDSAAMLPPTIEISIKTGHMRILLNVRHSASSAPATSIADLTEIQMSHLHTPALKALHWLRTTTSCIKMSLNTHRGPRATVDA
jgi:hypothetical protein